MRRDGTFVAYRGVRSKRTNAGDELVGDYAQALLRTYQPANDGGGDRGGVFVHKRERDFVPKRYGR